MTKKRKKSKKIEKKEVKKPKKPEGVEIDVFFSVAKIREHHRAGMKAYRQASKKKMTIAQWKEFFANY